MRGAVELPDVHDVVFVFQYGSWEESKETQDEPKGAVSLRELHLC